MNPLSDDELRARFEDLRAAERERAPDFRAVLERATRPLPGRARFDAPWRLSLGFSLAAAAVFALAINLARRSPIEQNLDAVPLSQWRSPTSYLLHTPASAILESPALLPSLLGPVPSPVHQRGKQP
jgi:hypothetical protein